MPWLRLVYRITQPSGKELILKICPRDEDYRREVYFLKYFADKLPVPQIVQEVPPEAGMKGAILMECLSGQLLKTSNITDELAYEIGLLLAKIHLNPAPGYGDITQPESLCLDPRVYFTLNFEEGMEECIHHLPKELTRQCRRYYDTHIHLLASVDGPCMIHRDFRPGNVIVHEGKLQGIIDWAGDAAVLLKKIFVLWSTGNGLCIQ